VSAIGSSVTKFAVGDRIGVGVFIDSCRKCASCLAGLQQYCEEGMTGTYNTMERDGKAVALGGYSNLFVINEDYAVHIPDNLPLDGVAPLLCAGITLYSPIRKWNVTANSKVAVMGLGGLGHMGVKFAAAMGAEVTVLSHSSSKKADALAMGAKHFVDTSAAGSLKPLTKKFDLVLNTVSAYLDINEYLDLLKLDGTLVVIGAYLDINEYLDLLKLDGTLVVIGLPGKPYEVNAGTLLNGRRRLAGSMIGGIPEMQEMLDFCGKHSIVSDVEIIEASYANTAYERTIASDVKYRFVIDGSTF
jgi:uncharacterized zinc-type alcohol dehydrogenase-like protein